jgi:hypothetical protein
VSTIWRVLRRPGFVTPQPDKRPRSSIIRFAAELPNERWQAGITHWALAGGTDVEILNMLDDHSRLAVASDVRPSFKAADVVATFWATARCYGLPAGLLTDNAAVFTGVYRGHGWVALERELAGLRIALRHSRPYLPQTYRVPATGRPGRRCRQAVVVGPVPVAGEDAHGRSGPLRSSHRCHGARSRSGPPRGARDGALEGTMPRTCRWALSSSSTRLTVRPRDLLDT